MGSKVRKGNLQRREKRVIHNTSRTVGAWVGKAACFSSAGAGLGALGEEPVAVETTAGGAQPRGECSPGSAGPGKPGVAEIGPRPCLLS